MSADPPPCNFRRGRNTFLHELSSFDAFPYLVFGCQGGIAGECFVESGAEIIVSEGIGTAEIQEFCLISRDLLRRNGIL